MKRNGNTNWRKRADHLNATRSFGVNSVIDHLHSTSYLLERTVVNAHEPFPAKESQSWMGFTRGHQTVAVVLVRENGEDGSMLKLFMRINSSISAILVHINQIRYGKQLLCFGWKLGCLTYRSVRGPPTQAKLVQKLRKMRYFGLVYHFYSMSTIYTFGMLTS